MRRRGARSGSTSTTPVPLSSHGRCSTPYGTIWSWKRGSAGTRRPTRWRTAHGGVRLAGPAHRRGRRRDRDRRERHARLGHGVLRDPVRPGDRILTSASEYDSNVIAFLHLARDARASRWRSSRTTNRPDLASTRCAARSTTTYGSSRSTTSPRMTVWSTRSPRSAAVAREAGALYLLDACQSVGQIPVDVERIGCDLLSATSAVSSCAGRVAPASSTCGGRRWTAISPVVPRQPRAPTGPAPTPTSCVPTRDGSRSVRTLGRDSSVSAAAAEYALEIGLDAIEHAGRSALAALLRDRLAEVPAVTVRDRRRASVGDRDVHAQGLEPLGRSADARARTGSTSRISVTGHRYDEGAAPMPRVRASVHYYNTEDELDRACAAVAGL